MNFEIFDQTGPNPEMPTPLRPLVGLKVISATLSSRGHLAIGLENQRCVIFRRRPGVGLAALEINCGTFKPDVTAEQMAADLLELFPGSRRIEQIEGSPFTSQLGAEIQFGDWMLVMLPNGVEILHRRADAV